LEISEGGTSSIAENGNIVGLGLNKFSSAQSGFNLISSSKNERVEDFYNFYYGSGCSGSLSLTESDVKYDKCNGSIDYNFGFSDDPQNSGCFIVESDSSIQLSKNGAYSFSKRGSVRSSCGGSSGRLSGSIDHFKNNISGKIEDDLWNFYSGSISGYDPECFCGKSGMKFTQSTHQYDKINGKFSFDYLYDLDCSNIENDCFRANSSINIEEPVHKVSLQYMPYFGEIAQKQNTSNMHSYRQQIEVVGKCNSGLEDYFSFASGLIIPPSSGTYYMNEFNYSYVPDLSSLSMSLGYQIGGFREYQDYDV
jgi:hypothetical protein